jgi:hypothetical protein
VGWTGASLPTGYLPGDPTKAPASLLAARPRAERPRGPRPLEAPRGAGPALAWEAGYRFSRILSDVRPNR